MKRSVLMLGLVLILAIGMLTSCIEQFTYEQTTADAVVLRCERGTFRRNAYYANLANMYLMQNNLGQWNIYRNLAQSTGKYDYQVTVEIDGEEQTVVREDALEVGQNVEITVTKTYDEAGQLVSVEYQ